MAVSATGCSEQNSALVVIKAYSRVGGVQSSSRAFLQAHPLTSVLQKLGCKYWLDPLEFQEGGRNQAVLHSVSLLTNQALSTSRLSFPFQSTAATREPFAIRNEHFPSHRPRTPTVFQCHDARKHKRSNPSSYRGPLQVLGQPGADRKVHAPLHPNDGYVLPLQRGEWVKADRGNTFDYALYRPR